MHKYCEFCESSFTPKLSEKMMNKLCMVLLIAFVVPSIASAGGGSTKATGKAEFTNTATIDAYVILDRNTPPAIADFAKLGGVVIPPGGKHTFISLKAGKHMFGVKFSSATPAAANPSKTGEFNTSNGKTTKISLAQ